MSDDYKAFYGSSSTLSPEQYFNWQRLLGAQQSQTTPAPPSPPPDPEFNPVLLLGDEDET